MCVVKDPPLSPNNPAHAAHAAEEEVQVTSSSGSPSQLQEGAADSLSSFSDAPDSALAKALKQRMLEISAEKAEDEEQQEVAVPQTPEKPLTAPELRGLVLQKYGAMWSNRSRMRYRTRPRLLRSLLPETFRQEL